ncbi:MAG: DNA repair protein RecO [Oscillospiraceae bacterium]|nr:DNA repair protein RecO [Oscillospiraceae bacterium]
MYINTKGLILREVPYKETSKILTVLTADAGRITVSAKGARRKGSKTAAATQLLCFSDMTLSENRDRYTLTEARPIEMFEGLRYDLEALALGSYFAQVLEAVSDEDMQNPAILSLGLNALYVLSENKYPQEIIKPAFEMRLMALSGFAPLLDACSVCGSENPVNPRLDLTGGTIRCRDCREEGEFSDTAPLCQGSFDALRHIISCDSKRVFSFSLGLDAAKRLYRASESYLKTQLDRGFSTLEYYNSVRI